MADDSGQGQPAKWGHTLHLTPEMADEYERRDRAFLAIARDEAETYLDHLLAAGQPMNVARQEGKRALLDGITNASAARQPDPVAPPSREEFAESVRDAVRRVMGNHVPYAAPAFAAATRAAVALEDAQMRAMALAASHHVPAFVQDVVVEAQRRGEILGSPAAGWESVAADLRDARWQP